jgi:DNA-binding response OmpR family regulator
MRVLIVEDDKLLGQGILAGLRQAGMQPDWVEDGLAARHALDAESFSAVVLDLGLPRLSGLDLLRQLRAAGSKVPVLVLTARDTAEDVVTGLDAGADDYVIKPFDLNELCARLRAIVRRAAGTAAPALRQGRLELLPAERMVRWDEKEVELSNREFDLLHELLLNAGRVLTRPQLETKLYPWGEEVESNAIEVHIHHLRKKLAPELIRTVRGVGYMVPRD